MRTLVVVEAERGGERVEDGFRRVVAPEVPGGSRVNVVSPGWVSETLRAMGSAGGTPAARVAELYVRAVEDETVNGRTLTVA